MTHDSEPEPPDAHRGFREAAIGNLKTLFPYLVAGALFIVFGVIDPKFMLNWAPGLVLLLIVVWVVPALWRRWRRR
jgi:hypothetical protein